MLKLKIADLEQVLFEEEIEILVLKTKTGEMGVMGGHIPLTAELTPGPHRIKKGEKTTFFYTLDGIAHIERDKTYIYAVKLHFSQQVEPDFHKYIEIPLVKGKSYDYDAFKKNLIKEFSEKLWKEGKRM